MLNSEDISSKFLRKKMGGYKTEDVNTLLQNIKVAYKNIQRENNSLLKKIEELKNKLSKYKEIENLIHNTMINAQKSADLCIKEAKYKADLIIKSAKEKSNSLVEKIKYEIYDQEKVLQNLKDQNMKFRSKLLDSYKEHIQLIGAFPTDNKEKEIAKSSVTKNQDTPIKITGIESENKINKECEEKNNNFSEVFDKKQEVSKKETVSTYKKYTIKSLNKFSDLKLKESCCL